MNRFSSKHKRAWLGLYFAVAAAVGNWTARGDTRMEAEGAAFFESKIRPLLADHCYECHSSRSKKVKGALLLDTREGLRQGGIDGAVIVPNDPDKSMLIESVRYNNEDLQMPPKEKLSDAQIADLEKWVKMGAPDPRAGDAAVAKSGYDMAAARQQWSFRSPVDSEPPKVKNSAWAHGAIDPFILAKLEEKNLAPAAPADKRTLIRRATFDLTGLPPTAAEVDMFLAESSTNAYKKVIDRLLASPQYGEQWGRHWLDQVRYADSVDKRQIGQPGDINEAWRYRDWVVQAFNEDLPYDQFIINQFAGDLLPGLGENGFNPDGIVATSMLAIGRWEQGEADKEKMMTDIVDDQIDVTGRTFLGLTLACARCHDHKFDPIPTRDYYALAGIFYSSHVIPEVGSKGGDTMRLRVPLDSPAALERREKLEEDIVATQKQADQITDQQIAIETRKLIQGSSGYLEGMAEYKAQRTTNANLTAAEFAKTFIRDGVESVLLARWADHLSWTEPTALSKVTADLLGEKGVYAWRNAQEADTPSVLINTTKKNATPAGIKLPPQSVVIHPSPKGGVAVAWKAPVRGRFRIVGRVMDANSSCGNGIEWTLEKMGSGRTRLATGAIANGGEQKFADGQGGAKINSVEFQAGDILQISVLPNGEHGCDSTMVELEIADLELEGRVWNLGKQLAVTASKAVNPAEDGLGNTKVWFFYDLVDQRSTSPEIPADSILAQWLNQVGTPQHAETNAAMAKKIEEGLQAADLKRRERRRAQLEEFKKELETIADDEISAASKRIFTVNEPLVADVVINSLYLDLNNPRGLFWKPARDQVKQLPSSETTLQPVLAELERLKKKLSEAPKKFAHGVREGGVPKSNYVGIQDTKIQIRGRYDRLGDTAPRGFPTLLAGDQPPSISEGSGRLQLAKWIASPQNPMTARVMANRLWQFHFGEGIVSTPSNYGKMGQPASHPELLDFLALRFIESGWSIKAMHRAIMLSAAYQQSTVANPETLKVDPDNRLFGRMNRTSLSAEELRDSILAVSGSLELATLGGPPIRESNAPRRTLYLMTVRSDSANFRTLFDGADPTAIVEKRVTSTVAPQALFLLNNSFVIEQSKKLAQRSLETPAANPAERIQNLYQTFYGRLATQLEIDFGLSVVVSKQIAGTGAVDTEALEKKWTRYCQVLLCANEFMYVD